MSTVDRESTLCECGHMRGIHKTAAPSPCATVPCGCKGFRERTLAASAEPPRVIPGRVERELPAGTANGDDRLDDAVTRREPEPPEPQGRAMANFAVHLNARMRALGWDAAALAERSGLSAHLTGRAVNGTAVELGTAERLAVLTGGYLATMIGPYHCSTCHGEPPPGFACLECGTETRAAS